MMIQRPAWVALLLLTAAPALGQVGTNADQDSYSIVTAPSPAASPTVNSQGRTATVGDARIGERQTRAATEPGFRPLDRVQNRIVSRIDSRLRTRIDRNYDPDASTRPLAGVTTATKAIRGEHPR